MTGADLPPCHSNYRAVAKTTRTNGAHFSSLLFSSLFLLFSPVSVSLFGDVAMPGLDRIFKSN